LRAGDAALAFLVAGAEVVVKVEGLEGVVGLDAVPAVISLKRAAMADSSRVKPRWR